LCFYISISLPFPFSISIGFLISLFWIGLDINVHIYCHRKLAI
jgi:hypothetical protein